MFSHMFYMFSHMFYTKIQFDKFFVSKFSFTENYKCVNHLVVLFNCLNLISLERL